MSIEWDIGVIKRFYALGMKTFLIHELKGAKLYTKIDVNTSYPLVLVVPLDVWKITFKSNIKTILVVSGVLSLNQHANNFKILR